MLTQRLRSAGEPPHEVVTDPATHQTMVTGLTWIPVVAISDLAAIAAACQTASGRAGGGEGTTVMTLHVTSGPPAALAERFGTAADQLGAARLAANGQPRRVAAPFAGGGAAIAAVSTSKLSFVDVAAASAEQATATTAGRRGLSNLRSLVLVESIIQQGVSFAPVTCRAAASEGQAWMPWGVCMAVASCHGDGVM